MAYKQIFKVLPKEIEDLIYEYNADHRELLKPVLLDIVLINPRRLLQPRWTNVCMWCDKYIGQRHRRMGFQFCSASCYNIVAEDPHHNHHPYIEVLLYGTDYYNEDYLTRWGYTNYEEFLTHIGYYKNKRCYYYYKNK